MMRQRVTLVADLARPARCPPCQSLARLSPPPHSRFHRGFPQFSRWEGCQTCVACVSRKRFCLIERKVVTEPILLCMMRQTAKPQLFHILINLSPHFQFSERIFVYKNNFDVRYKDLQNMSYSTVVISGQKMYNLERDKVQN